ncbi:MAG: acylneuraminate cytidylyltransferase family protein [Desulfamplus sp.]|nr:acylneuraminate cytidylyltransferase family protein [Desulfamplus sp.]
MNVIALIFARGGSKGLPGKNIRILGDKPLIAWAIDHARAVPRISRIIVSTDSEDIASVAREHGAEVPFLRPAELARDDSPEWLAWRHAINFLLETEHEFPEVIVSVPATAPLRSPLDIENCLDEYENGEVDVVITVSDANRSPYFNMVTMDSDKNANLVMLLEKKIFRRQDVPVVYDMATVAYVARSEFVLSNNSIFEGRVRAVKIPRERALDIDTYSDFQIAECLLNKGLKQNDKP